MTEEDFLKRWSRRKREADAAKPAAPEGDADAKPAREDAAAPDATPNAQVEQAEFDVASLPPIESITALSDVTAFLRAGVPVELTRAALRRVWAADPAIRDFVGLAENAWDFTDPNAMTGFGPLESTDEIRRMIAQIVDSIGEAARPAADEASPGKLAASENSNDSNVMRDADGGGEVPTQLVSMPDQTHENPLESLGEKVLLHSNKVNVAPQRDVTEVSAEPRQSSQRQHGRALPR